MGEYLHPVGLGHETSVVGSADGTDDGSLLLIIGEALSGEVGSSALRNLDDDG